MPLPNSNFIAMFPLQEAILDKDTGLPLANGYILFFEDEARTVPKNVFVQTQSPGPTYSYTNIGSQVTLSSIGTTQYLGTDTIIFLYPYDALGNLQTYYIQVYSSTNVFQFDRSNWPPGAVASGSTSAGIVQSGNIISNPQFANVLFNTSTGATFNVSGTKTTQIAPDWNIITTGTGSFTVNQIGLTDDAAPGEPAYAIDIVSSNVNTIILSQRITNSPRILENTFASGTFIAQAIAPTTNAIITMNYVPSMGTLTPIVTGTALPGSFSPAIAATTPAVIPETNTNAPGPNGYVDIQLVIPAGSHVQISAVQLVSVENNTIVASYVQESVPRQIDHLFHYYQPQINFKPIPSLLTGWDFALNPQQFGITSFTTTPIYVWDQTICASAVNTINVSQNGYDGSFNATTTVNSDAFYMLQYLGSPQAFKTAQSNLSVNISGYLGAHPGVTATVYLYYSTGGGTIPTLPTTIGTINASGVFTLTAANWALIPQLYGTNNSGAMSLNTPTDLGFNGWNGAANFDNNNSNNNFAIVVTFAVPTSGTVVSLNSISVVPGDIPTRPAPQTPDQVLQECEFYFEKSYASNVTIGSSTANDIIYYPQSSLSSPGSPSVNLFASPFEIIYRNVKRVSPTTVNIGIWSQVGTASNVSATLFYDKSGTGFFQFGPSNIPLSNWTVQNVTTKTATYYPNTVTPLITKADSSNVDTFSSGNIQFHYAIEARLGVV